MSSMYSIFQQYKNEYQFQFVTRQAFKNDVEEVVWKGNMHEVCPISLESFLPGELVIRLSCGHIFSKSNIITWLQKKQKCPLCRKSIVLYDFS